MVPHKPRDSHLSSVGRTPITSSTHILQSSRSPAIDPASQRSRLPRTSSRQAAGHGVPGRDQGTIMNTRTERGSDRGLLKEEGIPSSTSRMPVMNAPPFPSNPATALPRAAGSQTRYGNPALRRVEQGGGLTDSSNEQARRNILRRKPSTISQHSNQVPERYRSGSTTSPYNSNPSLATSESFSTQGGYKDPFPGSLLGMTMPSAAASSPLLGSTGHKTRFGSRIKDDVPHRLPHKISTDDLPPPTPLYTHSAGSSSRYTDSPGAFSRTSTPTSLSSHSPGTHGSSKTPRINPASPTKTRPPLSRRRAAGTDLEEHIPTPFDNKGLASVRESQTSSSSSSTVKMGDRNEKNEIRSAKKKNPLSPPAPSPPPRTSSRKPTTRRLVKPSEEARKPSERNTSITKQTSRPSTDASRRVPPSRPSRDGAPDLGNVAEGVPRVVHSNLTSIQASSHRRNTSHGSISDLGARDDLSSSSIALPTNTKSHPMSSQRFPGRYPSPSPSQASAPFSDISTSGALNSTSDLGRLHEAEAHSTSAAVSLVPSKSSSRFGIFSRKARSDTSDTPSERPHKLTKRGPVVGTGHEGYPRYGTRGRSGSNTDTVGSEARSGSVSSAESHDRNPDRSKTNTSSKGFPEIESYFADRLNPVVIGGGGSIIDNRKSPSEAFRSGSSQGSVASRPSLESKGSSQISRTQFDHQLRQPRDVKYTPGTSTLKRGVTDRRPSESTDDVPDVKPSLAVRRSLHRSQLLKEAPLKIPSPINIMDPHSSLASRDAEKSKRTHGSAAIPVLKHGGGVSEGHEGNWLRPIDSSKKLKSPRKWKFFQRSQTSSERPEDATVRPLSPAEVEVSVSQAPAARPIAHYAMLETDDTGSVSDDLEAIMHELETGSLPEEGRPGLEQEEKPHVQSILLPSPPSFRPELFEGMRAASPKVMLRKAEPAGPEVYPNSESTGDRRQPDRPSRLPQVGRIPRVVSKRHRQRDLPDQPFSRPFGPLKPSPILRQGAFVNADLSIEHSVSEPNRAFPSSVSDQSPSVNEEQLKAATGRNPEPREQERRLDTSDQEKEFFRFSPRKMSQVSGSSSSGIISLSNLTSTITATIPPVGSGPGTNEVWNEYDDLIDDVLVRNVIPGTSLSFIQPVPLPIEPTPVGHIDCQPAEVEAENPVRSSSPLPGKEQEVCGVTLEPSPDLLAHHLSDTMPNTPGSWTSFLDGYEERNKSMIESTSAQNNREDIGEPASEKELENSTKRSSSTSGTEKMGVESQLNLRFGALMTSRWLSFGRVLFSPAHTEAEQGRQDRILILDGLGNDDWSFYTALTYPDVTVYNLSPSQSSDNPPKSAPESPFRPPSNHRQICHPDITEPFPFPRGFFAAVVLRFPVASSDASYRNIIGESKRVLRPGGYIETSVLDIDLMNMGNRARRAIRSLKIRIQAADSSISLKPASDNIQRLLHRNGFENLNRCMVGVPAAGKLSSSHNGSVSSQDKDLSLGDMLRNPSGDGDEAITKTVAKIGRWWYTRCYEMIALPHGDMSQSIWTDKALLRECENCKTSFRLLICYAQKPLQARRRTVSL